MLIVEFGLLILTVLGGVSGCLAIYLTRTSSRPGSVRLGQRLFLGTILGLALCIFAAAWIHSRSLPLLGICAGLLLVAMVWEMPTTSPDEPKVSSQGDL